MDNNRILNFENSFASQGIKPLRDTETYIVSDNNYLANLVVSETILHPEKNTTGHKHDNLDEVYIFTEGSGKILIDNNMFEVSKGDIIHVHGGEFHRVYNNTTDDLKFIAIFQKYIRKEDK